MDNLIRFFTKNSPLFAWLFLAILSIVMLCQTNPYHRSIWFGSANAVTGSIYEAQSSITGYFGLREINEDLLIRTGQLEEENLWLRQQLQVYQDRVAIAEMPNPQYRFMIAHVVNNSITQAENYITLDKGAVDGLTQDLGVADHNGVIGIVSKVSDHYAQVLSVLNPKLRISVMLKNTNAVGSLVWEGEDYRHANLVDVPRNVEYEIGDTVVTSGYTSSFPKNLPVGVISNVEDRGGSFLTFIIELFSDFNRLNDVHVILNDHRLERDLLENPPVIKADTVKKQTTTLNK